MSDRHTPEQLLAGVQTGIYLIFLLLTLFLNESIFREDLQLGILKNDTTNGLSRERLFLVKYLTGVSVEVLLWLLCTGCAVLALGRDLGLSLCAGRLFSVRAAAFLLLELLILALLQVISIYVRKTSQLILACLAVSTTVNTLPQAIPGAALLLTADAPTLPQAAALLAAEAAGIGVLCLTGCLLFRRIEF